MGYSAASYRFCHSVACSFRASVTLDINVSDTSASYISLKVAAISCVVMPLAYSDKNLAVYLREPRLVLLNQLRFEGVFTVTRRVQFNLAITAKQDV